MYGARRVQRLHRVGDAQDPGNGFGRIHAAACQFAVQSRAGHEFGHSHTEARAERLTARQTPGVDVARDLKHGGQMPVLHASRRVERGQAARIGDRKHHASPAVLLDPHPTLQRLAVFQSACKGVAPSYWNSWICHFVLRARERLGRSMIAVEAPGWRGATKAHTACM